MRPRLDIGGFVTVSVSATVVSGAGPGLIVNTANVTGGVGVTDPNTVNNSNTNGVDKGNASFGCYTNAAGVPGGNATQALAVTTGFEMAIPVSYHLLRSPFRFPVISSELS